MQETYEMTQKLASILSSLNIPSLYLVAHAILTAEAPLSADRLGKRKKDTLQQLVSGHQ
jgi:hypothetical protein